MSTINIEVGKKNYELMWNRKFSTENNYKLKGKKLLWFGMNISSKLTLVLDKKN
jgi:hypothetical protein